MKILIVSERTCIRTLKQIVALSHKHEVHLVSYRFPVKSKWCTTTTYYDKSEAKLREALKLYGFVDIIYVHNEPDCIITTVREIWPKKKIIMDIHDTQIWRGAELEKSVIERIMFDLIDGAVVPSEPCKEMLKPPVPCVVLPPYANKTAYMNRSWQWLGGLVYEGRADLKDQPHFMNYCKYQKLAEIAEKEDIPFHLYIPGHDFKKYDEEYKKAILHKGLLYEQMVSAMAFHDWGLCGNVDKFINWDVSMPNKLFDYIAGGLPIVAMNAKEVGKFVRKHKIGIEVSSIQELKERWDERQECQKNVFLKRYQFTMENQIHKLEELMCKILN